MIGLDHVLPAFVVVTDCVFFGIPRSVKPETARADNAGAVGSAGTSCLMARKIECRARRSGIIIDNNCGVTRVPPSRLPITARLTPQRLPVVWRRIEGVNT